VLDRFAFDSPWRRYHPAEKGLFALCGLGASLAASVPSGASAVFFAVSVVVLRGARVSARTYLRLLLIPSAFLAAGTITLAISFDGGDIPLVPLPLYFNRQGMDEAVLTFARALGGVSSLYLLALTTPMTEIIALLRRLKVPVVLLELMTVSYRQIDIFMRLCREMTVAQSSRLGYATCGNTFRSLSALGANLFLSGMERSRRTHEALLARGYGEELRVLEEERPLSRSRLLFSAVSGTVLILLSVGIGWWR